MVKLPIFSVLFFSIFFCGVSFAVPHPQIGDFDGDNFSDLSVAFVDRTAGTTAWLTRLDEQRNLFWFWFIPGDALVTGHYYGDQRYYPGIVWVRDARTPLEWYIKNPQGTENFILFGLPGDHVPNQADVDCDGITDFAVARNGTAQFPGFKVWYFALSGFGGQVVETVYGLPNDRVGLADMDGDQCAELIILRAGYEWFTRKLFASHDDFTQVQWGLDGDRPLLPRDVNKNGLADYIITRPTGTPSGQIAWVRYDDGTFELFPVGSDAAIPQVGKFTRLRNFFAWSERETGFTAFTRDGGSAAIFPFGLPANAIIRPDGQVIQPNDDARVSVGDTGSGDGGGPVPGCTVTSDFVDGPGNALYKPFSDNTGRPVILLPSEYWSGARGVSNIEVVDRDGNFIVNGTRRTCCPNGGRAHFDIPRQPSLMDPVSPITIKLALNDGTVECRVVPVASQRFD